MLGAGALGRPGGMVWGGRREEGSGWGTQVYLWSIHFYIWQNQNNIVKFKNKIKLKKKILQARLQQYMNRELSDVQLDLEKAEETEIKLPASAGSSKKQESSRKTSISALLTMPKALTVWIKTNCGKF